MLTSGESYFQAYLQLLDEIRERGFEPIGDIYEQELSLCTGDIAAEACTELSVQVERRSSKQGPCVEPGSKQGRLPRCIGLRGPAGSKGTARDRARNTTLEAGPWMGIARKQQCTCLIIGDMHG